uniref:Putative dynein gamma chain, flagellar outer arm n=1 Tax=Toxoplasma gondii TgCATBr9 TaxID=943120 RepID=A0A2T6IL69_TOXGO|nr:putative dynein gamma chain, flagellar outer arm [Toxoplasma gondii TgCATBr9]
MSVCQHRLTACGAPAAGGGRLPARSSVSLSVFAASSSRSVPAHAQSLDAHPKLVFRVFVASRFADFLREGVEDESGELLPAPKIYEPVPSLDVVRAKVNFYLEKYNEDNPSKQMNLVMFDAAVTHLMAISRIIQVRRKISRLWRCASAPAVFSLCPRVAMRRTPCTNLEVSDRQLRAVDERPFVR